MKNTIRTQIDRLLARREKINMEIAAIQNSECSHDSVEREPFRIEGYGEKTEFWYRCTCNNCLKYWTEPQ